MCNQSFQEVVILVYPFVSSNFIILKQIENHNTTAFGGRQNLSIVLQIRFHLLKTKNDLDKPEENNKRIMYRQKFKIQRNARTEQRGDKQNTRNTRMLRNIAYTQNIGVAHLKMHYHNGLGTHSYTHACV